MNHSRVTPTGPPRSSEKACAETAGRGRHRYEAAGAGAHHRPGRAAAAGGGSAAVFVPVSGGAAGGCVPFRRSAAAWQCCSHPAAPCSIMPVPAYR